MHKKGPALFKANGNIVSEVQMLELIFTTEESFPRPVALFNVRLDL